MLSATDTQRKGTCRSSTGPERLAARTDRPGQCRPAARQDRRRRRRLSRRRRAARRSCARSRQAEKTLLGDAGQQVLSRRRRRQAFRRAASADRAGRACRRRADRRLQTPGGCGALRLGFQLVAAPTRRRGCCSARRPGPTIMPIIHGVGLELGRISLLRPRPGRDPLRRDDGGDRAGPAPATSSCCTAAATTRPAPTSTQTNGPMSRAIVAERGLMPFVDIAYQGLGAGSTRMRRACAACSPRATKCWSRKAATRISASIATASARLFIKTAQRATAAKAMGHVLQIAREMWSMPPDHGAAAVRIVLEDDALTADWRAELDAMRDRINPVRAADRRRRPAPRFHRPSSSACSRCCR